MEVIDFTSEYITQASALALSAYEEERGIVPSLPMAETVPDLTSFADNGLGVAAFESGKMVGFLCCYPPFDNAFSSTKVKGVFSPMGANAAIKENRAKIYAAMYQAAGAKWVRAGAISHAICLYAHDKELQSQFYQYGFGLRCIDAIRSIESISYTPHVNYDFVELNANEFPLIYLLELELNHHYRKSPFFMNRKPYTMEEFIASCKEERMRCFVVKYYGDLCAYLQISNSGETFVASGSDYCHIKGAFCLPEHRGKGIYQTLINMAISTLKLEGYTRIGVDFESLNPTAYGFWLKYFVPYTHSVVRRIDECILEL